METSTIESSRVIAAIRIDLNPCSLVPTTRASRPREALVATIQLSRDLIQMNADWAMMRMIDMMSEGPGSEEHREALEKYIA